MKKTPNALNDDDYDYLATNSEGFFFISLIGLFIY